MEEIHKTEMRNYLMAGGFTILATHYFIVAAIYFLLSLLGNGAWDNIQDLFLNVDNITNVVALLLVAFGIMLAALRKRDLTAITFIMVGAIQYLIGQFNGVEIVIPEIILDVFLVILAAIILVSKDKKKYLLFLIPGFIGVRDLLLSVIPPLAISILDFIFVLLMFYFAFACASERIKLPGRKVLTADVETDFRVHGSIIGYIFFGLNAAIWVGVYLCGIDNGLVQAAIAFDGVAGVMMILAGILLFIIGKMKFTPVMFILMGFLSYLAALTSSALIEMVIGTIFMVVGLFAILRTESRILPGIMLIIYGITFFVEALLKDVVVAAGSSIPPLMAFAAVLNGIVALIAVYIAFAVFSNKKLPLI